MVKDVKKVLYPIFANLFIFSPILCVKNAPGRTQKGKTLDTIWIFWKNTALRGVPQEAHKILPEKCKTIFRAGFDLVGNFFQAF